MRRGDIVDLIERLTTGDHRAGQEAEWPHPAAPRWMAWAPLAAMGWALAYGAVRVWWTVGGAGSIGPPSSDLLIFTGWGAVALCAAATGVALALRTWP